MKKLLVCFALLSVLALSIGALAQVQNGAFAGSVVDPSGAAVPNAKVTITNLATNLSVVATTNQTGNYSARELPPGSYKMVAEAPGFKTFTNNNVTLNAGTNQRVDFKMTMGQAREVVEVQGEATQVSTEDSKLAYTVGTTQIANLPLNGRNVYDLVKLSPGAVDTRSVDLENDGSPGGAGTVVNGVRQDFNGFTINGVSNKALSGGAVNQPIEDTVQEFQQLTLNMSAQYGNSAGSITNLVTKSGTNDLHGSLFGFVRNDAFDAANFFVNQAGAKKPPVRYNQIGGTLGGPIVKDKVFFFAAYQHDHFTTSNTPTPLTVESPQWRAAVAQANPGSVAALLYSTFTPSVVGTPVSNCGATGDQICGLQDYVDAADQNGNTGQAAFSDYLCPSSGLYGASTSAQLAQATAAAIKIGNVIGVTPADMAGCATPIPLNLTAPFVNQRNGVPVQYNTVSIFKSQQKGNLFNGHEASVRFDWDPSDKNRFFLQGNWLQTTDMFGPGLPQSARGFVNPTQNKYPNLQFSFIHTFNPKVLNEFRAGYLGNMLFQRAGIPGVPAISMDDGTMGFGSYNGYPQFFKENIYSYSDMVSLSHGNHNIKIGGDVRRNIENSEFDVSRPSYYFTDQLAFTGDIPYGEAAGVDPHICAAGPPCSTFNPNPVSNLSTNIRHWRNIEFGAYFQDDWKATKRLTLNLGLRYDLYQRHHELNNLATTFLPGPGNLVIDNLQTGDGWLKSANLPLASSNTTTLPGECANTPFTLAASVEAGVCGPGGFAPAKSLGKGDHTDFGPRVGFAWDIFGDGKTSLRGGYGLSYEGTLYNPLSNSRWDPPYYSFNQAFAPFAGNGTQNIIYGPQSGGAASFTGPPDPLNHQGPGANSIGNIMGWDPTNQNLAVLTGIVLPQGIKDPYVHNFFMSIQREILPRTVVELDYVGTAGHKLFRAQDINRIPGGRLPANTCVTDNFGRQLCSQKGPDNPLGRLNPNYGTLRNWQNVVNSNYNSLQAQLKMQSFHGVTMNVAYTYSHSIDEGSTWHSGATTANGHAAGEEFSLDQTMPQLDRGNSIYDIRNRLVVSYVWELPFFNHSSSGLLRNVLGGWQLNGIWSYQSGAHWSPFCRSSSKAGLNAAGLMANTGCDFNLDNGRNDRPNALAPNVNATHDMWANGWGGIYTLGKAHQTSGPDGGDGTSFDPGNTFFTRPCPGCAGSEGRNTFVGPKYFDVSPSLIKNFKFTERVGMQFRWEVFNAFNHTNFQLPGAQSSTHNRVNDGSFGQAGGTFDARIQQFGLKLMF